jgi:hypothetical protein
MIVTINALVRGFNILDNEQEKDGDNRAKQPDQKVYRSQSPKHLSSRIDRVRENAEC